eukprot:CAMPEP_0197186362 /NCGR_PEP_ID=MMETSP1423-20130617/13769_1 /TAXON_ID=476441 /ORGANISM="Pseudo-nitzschia heimii, Strain UNC1101" /LENGTH=796 /DNA_ID=CAMNT_0042637651 /DNA_START=28 /DNA_END=2415 /DNA_ORIENTATION=+
MTAIPKGRVIQEVTPYAVVPLYDSDTPTSAGTIVTGCHVEIDPTRVPNLRKLPRWSMCKIWDQKRPDNLFETNRMKNFLRKLRRMAFSTSTNADASWHILCILTVLRVVNDNICEARVTTNNLLQKDHDSYRNEIDPIQQTSKGDSQTQWWSSLLSEQYDDDKERNMNPVDDDCEDENRSLLVELWPMIRSHIPWIACERLYHRVKNRMHILTIPHPLTTWAQKTLFELNTEEYERSWKVFQNIECQEIKEKLQTSSQTKTETDERGNAISSPPNRLRASKLWLDRVANIPERLVGVLIDDPLRIFVEDPLKSGVSERSIETSTALSLPRCYQSCLPNTCLELYVITDTEKNPNTVVPTVRWPKKIDELRCKWISLYDLSSSESQNKNRTLSTMPKSSKSNCFQCVYKSETVTGVSDGKFRTLDTGDIVLSKINLANLVQARRLAHSYFFKEEFENAMFLYQQCHRYLAKSNTNCTTADTSSTNFANEGSRNAHMEADLWHAMGAVLLSQQKFAQAQMHWKNGSHYNCIHRELSEQLEKQRAYQYFDPQPETRIPQLSDKLETMRSISESTSQSIFTTSNVIDADTCRVLIAWAEEYAENNGGWTGSRHYAVPTTDLPIHRVPKLLEWFQEWMPQVLFPALRGQFGANMDERFYVHDAFLVRYEGRAANSFLPLHFDESTHSCVLALNDDFDGGGSYIYELNRSITPSPGAMVSFLGNQCLHGGNPVTRSVRFILAIFLYLDKDIAHDPHRHRDKSLQIPTIKTNSMKRKVEARHDKNGMSKLSKKTNELQSDEGA